MFLTVHSLVALTTTKYISHPLLLFIINFILHYILDAIPHGDGDDIERGFKNKNLNYFILALLDFIFIIIISFNFYQIYKISINNIIFAVLGAILPDILWGIYYVTKLRIFKWADDLNLWAHQILKYKPHYIFEYTIQIIPIIVCYFLLK